jgi:hypothetical protein
MDHAWRVFEDGQEYLFKHINIQVPCWDETDGNDWNIACEGKMTIDKPSSTAIIRER